jgi:hypothetical protein
MHPLAKRIRIFLVRFVILFGLLIIPWPGLKAVCNAMFAASGNWLIGLTVGPDWEITFNKGGAHGGRIEILNRKLMQPDGSGPVRNVDLDPYGFLYRPWALLVALVLATPFSLRRRLRHLAWSNALLAVICLLILEFVIWNESLEVSLVKLSPFWKNSTDWLQVVLVQQLELAIPVLVWLWVCFRPKDFGSIVREFRSTQSRQEQSYKN